MSGGKYARSDEQAAAGMHVERAMVALEAAEEKIREAADYMRGRHMGHAERRVQLARTRVKDIHPILRYAQKLALEDRTEPNVPAPGPRWGDPE